MRTYPPLPPASQSPAGVGEAFGSFPQETGTRAAARAALDGRKKGVLALLPFLGPAFIACVAYIDPGNFATNIQGGSAFGYNLLWVIALANLMAMLLQTMSAKLGLATGHNLAELCRQEFRKPVVYAMWIISEIAAMATDLAEFLGASIAINLLFGLPLLYATLITGVATYLILMLERRGFRPIEAVISALVGVIAVCYMIETFFSHPNWGQVGFHTVVPWLGGTQSILFSVGIIGATVMPHVIYLHSSLTQQRIIPRSEKEARRIFRWSIPDVVIAMGLAGLVNMAMLYMAASTFFAHGQRNVADINTAYLTLTPLLGGAASLVFGLWPLQFHRRHDGRAGDYAGVCGLHHSHLATAPGDDDSCRARRRDRLQSDQHPGDQPGRAKFRFAAASDHPDHVYTSSRSDGYPGK